MHEREYSDDTAKLIDQEVENLITEAANRARAVIKSNLKRIEMLKDKLLEKETVEAEEVIEILSGSIMPKEAALY
jgi:cell division protease FtsH